MFHWQKKLLAEQFLFTFFHPCQYIFQMHKLLLFIVVLCMFAHACSQASRSGRGRGSSSYNGRSTGGRKKGFGGSIHSNKARTAALALAGGYVGYNLGKIAREISSGSSYMYLNSYNRYYFYGNRYYASGKISDIEVCRYAISSTDEFFDLIYEEDGSRINEIVYQCKVNQHCCDGLDCCNNGLPNWAEFLLVIGGLGLFTGCCYCFAYYCSPAQLENVEDKQDDDNQPSNCPQSEIRPYYIQKDQEISTCGQPKATDPVLPIYAQLNQQSSQQYLQMADNPSYAPSFDSNSDKRSINIEL